ncbi:hypothetical protein BDQ17DRAFT_1414450, partial [Cyathus striatus]
MSSSFNLQIEQAFKIGVLYRTYAYLAATTFMLYDSFDTIASEYAMVKSQNALPVRKVLPTCFPLILSLLIYVKNYRLLVLCKFDFWLVPINKRRGGVTVLTTTVNAILALRIGAFYNNERNCLNLTIGPPGYPVCWGPNSDIALARRSHNYLLIGGIGTMVTSSIFLLLNTYKFVMQNLDTGTAITSNWRSFIQLKFEPLAKIYIRDGFIFFF